MKELKYKGYFGSTDIDVETGMIVGRLLFISDVIGYSGPTVPELKAAFEEAVNDYLETCRELGDEPETPCKGSFNVRMRPELHRDAALYARHNDMTLNEVVGTAVDELLKKNRAQHHHHHHHHEVTVAQKVVEDRVVASSSHENTWSTNRLVVN